MHGIAIAFYKAVMVLPVHWKGPYLLARLSVFDMSNWATQEKIRTWQCKVPVTPLPSNTISASQLYKKESFCNDNPPEKLVKKNKSPFPTMCNSWFWWGFSHSFAPTNLQTLTPNLDINKDMREYFLSAILFWLYRSKLSSLGSPLKKRKDNTTLYKQRKIYVKIICSQSIDMDFFFHCVWATPVSRESWSRTEVSR